MSENVLDDLFGLEDEFYREGYDAGVADSVYAGLIEGKVFGIEKGYEKAIELARLQGRTLVWRARSNLDSASEGSSPSENSLQDDSLHLSKMCSNLGGLPKNSRLDKHIESLLSLSDKDTIATANSDAAVTEFDDKLSRAKAKAKVIANITGEQLNPGPLRSTGIEDATGLNARS